MTYSPQSLLDLRAYLLPITGLDPAGLGIQHYAPGGGGYHEGHDLLHAQGVAPEDPGSDYSYTDSLRDRAGLTDAASAIDVGDFTRTYGGRQVSLRDLNRWLVGQLNAAAPDTLDIREIIYTLDGRVVHRWDRTHQQPDAGDDTHLYHTHFSYFRDSENTDKTALFRRYFAGTTTGGDDMPLAGIDKASNENAEHYLQSLVGLTDMAGSISDTQHANLTVPNVLARTVKQLAVDVAELKARPAGTVTLSEADRADIAARVAAAMSPAIVPLVAGAVRSVVDGATISAPPAPPA